MCYSVAMLCCRCYSVAMLCCRCYSVAMLCCRCYSVAMLCCRCYSVAMLCCRCYSVAMLCCRISDVLVFGKDNYLLPRSTRQYLYKITPLVPVRIPEKVGTYWSVLVAMVMMSCVCGAE